MATERRQRKKENRARKVRVEKKRAARREMLGRLRKAATFGLFVALVLVIGAWLGRPKSAGLPSAYEAFRNKPTACGAVKPAAEKLTSYTAPEDQQLPAGARITATLATSCGDIVVSLDPTYSPQSVNSFVFLARKGFYDGTVFHRIAANLLIQGGDPQADGRGGPGYHLPDEYPPSGYVYEKGTVALFNTGSRTTGSQFFIVVGPEGSALGPQYNVLGKVEAGDDTITKIIQVPTARQATTNEKSLPLETVYLESVGVDVSG